MEGHQKRKYGSPTGNTPGKPRQKTLRQQCFQSSSRKSLFEETNITLTESSISIKPEWSRQELSGLIQFIALYAESQCWPTHKNVQFWKNCAKFVAEFSGMPMRTGNACRMKVLKYLKKDFKTITEAEEAYGIDYFGKSNNLEEATSAEPIVSPGDIITIVNQNLVRMTQQQRLQLAMHIYQYIAVTDYNEDLKYFIPKDFIELSLLAMHNLRNNGKDNVLYDLSKCLGAMREHKNISRMDMNRMPFGLIAYNCKFFATDDGSNLHVPHDYMQWMESMYSYFGNSWASLHLGPMWSYSDGDEDKCKSDEDTATSNIIEVALAGILDELTIPDDPVPPGSSNHTTSSPLFISDDRVTAEPVSLSHSMGNVLLTTSHDPVTPEPVLSTHTLSMSNPSTIWSGISQREKEELKDAEVSPKEISQMFNAKVNVAGPSARTIRRSIAKSEFVCNTEIQMEALKKAKQAIPDGRWYIKVDATDMKVGLRESVQGKWSGDVDLGDKELQSLKKRYDEHLTWIKGLSVNARKNNEKITSDLKQLESQLSSDLEFLQIGLKNAKTEYEKKSKQKNVGEQAVFAAAWEVEEFDKILLMNSKLVLSINGVVNMLVNQVQGINIAKKISGLKKDAEMYVKGIFSKKRQAASHLLVFMISDERRCRKPYAIPVRALPYKSITDAHLQKLCGELKEVMAANQMVVVGCSTDGEFNSMRTKGTTRPISIVQLMMDAKAKARSISVKQIKKFMWPVKGKDGTIAPLVHHEVIPLEDIQWLYDYMHTAAAPSTISFHDALLMLRRKKFPFSYDPHPWVEGKDETLSNSLKSIMAHYLYCHSVLEYTQRGINFKEHLYVPEVDPKTGESFQEREDHNHVLKRIWLCTIAGCIPDLDLQAFVNCLNSPNSGLTYTALTGQHKQSVPDCERVFSKGVIKFMEENNFPKEARFVRLVHNWHKASDGRGLTEDTRHQYNMDMLHFILEDWMPWYWYKTDYSVMDVNRPIKGIQGLTREIVIALVANIEGQEQRRMDYKMRFLPPEHPRASATDDLEGFFAILHQLLGPTFDHKTFVDNYRKIEQEFVKRIDPDLPFYYWTGVNERFSVGPLKSFNEPSGKTERLDKVKISRRADPGVFVTNRASLPQKGSLSVRAQFHVKPETLPAREIDHE